ncbi:MAG: 23S rRNA (uracil(1939)-C(5))-methyltransferase RlmD, partial [Bulleidia sp.]
MSVCPQWKRCGGCSGMVQSYTETLEEKRKRVQFLFPKVKVDDPVGMAEPYRYRHKIYAVFGQNQRGQMIAGMYEESSHRIVRISDCAIQHPLANQIITQICHIADSMELKPYDEDRHSGILRQVYIRISEQMQKALVVLVIGSRELPGARYFTRQLKQHCPQMETLVLNWNRRQTSMVLGERFKVLYGRGWIVDSLCGVQFRISPLSFYQVNPAMTEILYKTALRMADIHAGDRVLDACCGIGTISLLAAKQAASVTGIEINRAAVRDAQYNAARNGITNAKFICADAGRFMSASKERYDIVIADPPRSGLSEGFLYGLLKHCPRVFVYISCNPETQARDLKILGNKYCIKKLVPVDQFPWTEHVETVALLSKLDVDKHIDVE